MRQTNSERTSISRFLDYIRPYHRILMIAVSCGIIRYLVPVVMPWTLKILVDDFLGKASHHPHQELHNLMIGLCGLYVIYGIASYFRSYFAGLTGHKIIFDLRQKLYLHVQQMSLSFFDRQKIGGVVSHMTTDIAAAQNFVGSALINTAMDLSCIVAIVIIICFVHLKLAIVSLSVLPLFVFSNYFLMKRIKAKSRDIHDQMQEISGDLHEQFAAISTIQSFTQEEIEALEFKKQSERYFNTVMSNVHLQSIALGITGFLTAIGPILVLWYGAMEVWKGALSVGTLMAFYAYLSMLYQPIQRLIELNLILINSLAAMDRIFKVFDIYPEVREMPRAKKIEKSSGEIIFEHVHFNYATEDKRADVLTDFSLHIPAGQTIALVGPSGAGKSTVIKLLPRFYDVTRGSIRLDGIDLRELTLKSLRQQMAIVSQDPILFSGTIAENLRYGKPEASDEEIRQAAHAAFADVFIKQLPKGYETEIGERGLRLSGGQKQRLAIARAFLKNSPVIILDEPTSALDAESEELIKQALKNMLTGRTALIIAHRLSTIEHADKVVVIDQGKIIEEGKHAELLASPSSLYRRYAERQVVQRLDR